MEITKMWVEYVYDYELEGHSGPDAIHKFNKKVPFTDVDELFSDVYTEEGSKGEVGRIQSAYEFLVAFDKVVGMVSFFKGWRDKYFNFDAKYHKPSISHHQVKFQVELPSDMVNYHKQSILVTIGGKRIPESPLADEQGIVSYLNLGVRNWMKRDGVWLV